MEKEEEGSDEGKENFAGYIADPLLVDETDYVSQTREMGKKVKVQ